MSTENPFPDITSAMFEKLCAIRETYQISTASTLSEVQAILGDDRSDLARIWLLKQVASRSVPDLLAEQLDLAINASVLNTDDSDDQDPKTNDDVQEKDKKHKGKSKSSKGKGVKDKKGKKNHNTDKGMDDNGKDDKKKGDKEEDGKEKAKKRARRQSNTSDAGKTAKKARRGHQQ